jgi:hypothetical protein
MGDGFVARFMIRFVCRCVPALYLLAMLAVLDRGCSAHPGDVGPFLNPMSDRIPEPGFIGTSPESLI